MSRQYRKKKKNKKWYIVAIIICFLLLWIVIFKPQEKEDVVLEEVDLMEEEQEEDAIVEKLQNMEERDRMEYYFSEFLDDIENADYELAYHLLYSEFRENYFPTLDSFTEYVKRTFSDMVNIEHENIERNGDLYILWINITDTINDSPSDKKEMNVVIQENDYHDFVMSFSVI